MQEILKTVKLFIQKDRNSIFKMSKELKNEVNTKKENN